MLAAKNQVLHQISGNLIDLHENLELEKHKIETEMTRQKKLIRSLRRRNRILSERMRQKDGSFDEVKLGDKCTHPGNNKDDSGRESDPNDSIETFTEAAADGKPKSNISGENSCVNTELVDTNATESKKIICYLTCYL